MQLVTESAGNEHVLVPHEDAALRTCALCRLPIRLEQRVAPDCGERELIFWSCGFHDFMGEA